MRPISEIYNLEGLRNYLAELEEAAKEILVEKMKK